MGANSPVGPSAKIANEGSQTPVSVDPKVLEDAVSKLNSATAVGPDNELVVTMSGHRMTVQIINKDTREVVEQISPPSVLRMYRRMASD